MRSYRGKQRNGLINSTHEVWYAGTRGSITDSAHNKWMMDGDGCMRVSLLVPSLLGSANRTMCGGSTSGMPPTCVETTSNPQLPAHQALRGSVWLFGCSAHSPYVPCSLDDRYTECLSQRCIQKDVASIENLKQQKK